MSYTPDKSFPQKRQFGRKSTKKFDGIDTPVIFRKGRPSAQSPDYPGINERTYVLPQGSHQREDGMALQADIVVEQDVPVTLRDGTVIRCDVYRPNKAGKFPAIMGWSPYGKRGSCFDNDHFNHPNRMDVPAAWEDGMNKFEAPNPSYWVAHDYVVLAPDSRGIYASEGDYHAWGVQDPSDEYDVIEWAAAQAWSNGKIGLSGNSMLAMSQWFNHRTLPPSPRGKARAKSIGTASRQAASPKPCLPTAYSATCTATHGSKTPLP